MHPTRFALLCAIVLTATAAWSDPTIRLTVDSLTPPGPYTPGQQVSVRGSVAYSEVPRPWGGGGMMTTQTRHSANVALEWIRTADDDWPEVPELKSATGNLSIADGPGWTPFEQKHGGARQFWSVPVNPPARTERTDAFNHAETIPFEGTFTVPNECVAIRLRATLDITVGANWFVSYYYYDHHPLQLDVPGVKHIEVTCERKPYNTQTRTVVVSDQSDRVTISGTAVDPRWGPLHRALVTASGAGAAGQAYTGPDGSYSIDLTLSEAHVIATKAAAGTLQSEAKSCNFRLATEADLVIITYQVNAPGYLREDGAFSLRVPPDTKTVWVSGLIGHKDATSEAAARQGRLELWQRVQGGTIMLQVQGARNVFDFHWGDFTGYVPVDESGSGAVRTRRIILLEPDPNAAVTVAADPNDPENINGFEQQLKVIWDKAPEDLRNLWLRMGLLIALKKDIDSGLTLGYSGQADNVRNYMQRWDNGGYKGKMYNSLWALRESVMLLPHPALATTADMDTHAQNASKLYAQLKGQSLTPKPGFGPTQALVQNILDKAEAGISW
ncbi:MAG: hypothetical protein GX131_16535 [candidate division WS1 bacterium]|nr:hypothetical protein [candidate division WS1 bacterium]